MLVGNRARIRQDAMSLNPIDDALFQKMAEDTGFCQEILQVYNVPQSVDTLRRRDFQKVNCR